MPQPLGEQDHRREGDPEGDQRDVDHERQGLHLPGLEEIGLMDGSERRRFAHCDHYPASGDAGSARVILPGRLPAAGGRRPESVVGRTGDHQPGAEGSLEDARLALRGPARDDEIALVGNEVELDGVVGHADVGLADRLVARALEVLGETQEHGQPATGGPRRRARAPAPSQPGSGTPLRW